MLEDTIAIANLFTAYRKVKQNEGSKGIDGLVVKEFGKWLKANYQDFQAEVFKMYLYSPSGERCGNPKAQKRRWSIGYSYPKVTIISN